jgi:methyl-accepting chemotaxis protein
MRPRNIALLSATLLAGAIGGSMLGPRPAEAVARELIELQHDVTSLLQGQKDLATQMTQDHTVMKTLVEQSGETVGKLNATMSGLQKSVQDVQANSGARLDTMSTQVQGLSDNLEEIKSRLGKLNQQLVDLQNTVQSLDAKISGGTAAPPTATPTAGGASTQTRVSRILRLVPRRLQTLSIPMACVTLPAENTTSLARNSRIT